MIRELVDLVVTATDSRSPIVRKPLPVDDPQRRRPDIARAQAVLGWSPRVPLREGLAKTVEYFRAELASGAQIFDRTAPAPGLAKSSQLAL
jgi:UDP-glucuronate decarboxylase